MSLVPDLVKLNTIPVNYEQNIETDLIETSTFQEATNVATGFARFDLQQKGFLHSQSKLFLSLIPQTNARAYLPVNIGIGSVIDRAVLKVGNQVINEISDWNHLHMIKSAQVDNENNVEREQYTTGRTMNHKYLMRKVVGGVSGSTFPLSGSYGLDNHRNYSGSAGAAAGAAGGSEGFNGQIQPFAVMDATDVNTVRESPTYSVDLSDLFPFLATHSLPLYMIDQQLLSYIGLHLALLLLGELLLCRVPVYVSLLGLLMALSIVLTVMNLNFVRTTFSILIMMLWSGIVMRIL